MDAIFIPFLTILLAEFFDKSQISLFLLATRTKHHLQLFFAAILAFAIVDGLAIVLGSFLANTIPPNLLRISGGLLFIVFGIFTFLQKPAPLEEKPTYTRNLFISTIGLIILAELGDKTQIVTGVFATQYNPFAVFIGVMLAFTLLSTVGIFSAKLLAKRINKTLLQKISSVVFILLGLFFLFLR